MAAPTEDLVREELKRVPLPDGGDVFTAGLANAIIVKDGNVHIMLEIDPAQAERMEPVRKMVEETVGRLTGVLSVTAVLTAHAKAGHAKAGQAKAGQAKAGQDATGGQASPPGPRGGKPQRPDIPGVRTIVAVASGKGGVGKSTTAANLAMGLKNKGLSVGILDADIYGPSMPRLLGIKGTPESDGKTIQPMENYGVKCMSIGFLVDEETPMIWRGPMVQSAIEQMLHDVNWGELDVLVVDLPPGTGDAQLTMAQRVPLTGAVIVSTPQDLALLDARKGLNMFRKVEVPVLGIIENMSYFLCPHCGERSDIFGTGGVRAEALRLGTDFLGEVPLHIEIRETSDEGRPVVATAPDSPQASPYLDLADTVWEKLQAQAAAPGRQAPRIVVE